MIFIVARLCPPGIEAALADIIAGLPAEPCKCPGTTALFFWIDEDVVPGASYKYTWRATQYGTTWYHEDAFYLFSINTGAPPTAENGLINGTNKYDGSGSYFSTTIEPGYRYKLRIINSRAYAHMKFMIDDHTMKVVAADLVPFEPYNASYVDIGLEQRYDVIITMNQTADNYWIRAIPQVTCTNNANYAYMLGILRYSSASNTSADPTSSGYTYTDACDNETMSLTPYLSKVVGSTSTASRTLPVALSPASGSTAQHWKMNGTNMIADWADPSLLMIEKKNSSYPSSFNVVSINGTADDWAYFVIEATNAVEHPMHIHGHDFWVLARGTGTFSGSLSTYAGTNTPRRDVVMLPASGYLVVAFPIDNPGAWLIHCHIAFHVSEGLSLQFVERYDDIAGNTAAVDVDSTWNSMYTAWDSYKSSTTIDQDDSGI
ncbi:hypothetical protein HK405_011310 [Cladochytrium tenue]|nr:hypothetical protein HK405_011310 [Cladochytrium tenue]